MPDELEVPWLAMILPPAGDELELPIAEFVLLPAIFELGEAPPVVPVPAPPLNVALPFVELVLVLVEVVEASPEVAALTFPGAVGVNPDCVQLDGS